MYAQILRLSCQPASQPSWNDELYIQGVRQSLIRPNMWCTHMKNKLNRIPGPSFCTFQVRILLSKLHSLKINLVTVPQWEPGWVRWHLLATGGHTLTEWTASLTLEHRIKLAKSLMIPEGLWLVFNPSMNLAEPSPVGKSYINKSVRSLCCIKVVLYLTTLTEFLRRSYVTYNRFYTQNSICTLKLHFKIIRILLT